MRGFALIVLACLVAFLCIRESTTSYATSSQPHLQYNLYIDQQYHDLFAKLWHSEIKIVFSFPVGRKPEFKKVLDRVSLVVILTERDCGYKLVNVGETSKRKVLISYVDTFDGFESDGILKIYRKNAMSKKAQSFFTYVKENPNKVSVLFDKQVSVAHGITEVFTFLYVPQHLDLNEQLILRKAIYKSIFNLGDEGLLENLDFPELLELDGDLKFKSAEYNSDERTCKEFAFIHLLCKYGGKQNMSFSKFMENSNVMKSHCLQRLKKMNKK